MNLLKTLIIDWNFIGYSGDGTTASAFASLVDGDNTLTHRNELTGRYESYIEDGNLGTNFDIEKGDAFFIWDDDGESVTI